MPITTRSMSGSATTRSTRLPSGHGLHNPGNFCYRNAVLLCLLHQPAFRDYMATSGHKLICPVVQPTKCTTCALVALTEQYWKPALHRQDRPDMKAHVWRLNQAILYNARRGYPHWSVTDPQLKEDFLSLRQTDSYDFLLYLMRMLRKQNDVDLESAMQDCYMTDEDFGSEALAALSHDKTRLNDLFKISLESQWDCCECRKFHTSRLGIDDQLDGFEIDVTAPGSGLMLEQYLRHNVFDEDKQIRCESQQCQQAFLQRLVPAGPNNTASVPRDEGLVRRVEQVITSAPEILVIHQKRFRQVINENGEPQFRSNGEVATEKLDDDDHPVYFTKDLDLSDWADEDTFPNGLRYSCEGIVAHHGSLQVGHYISAVKEDGQASYFALNDSEAPQQNQGGTFKELQTPLLANSDDADDNMFDPYIMFYRRTLP